MITTMRPLLVLAFLANILGVAAAWEGDEEDMMCSVAAMVNDEIITSYEVEQRVRLLVNTSGVQISDDDLVELKKQILNGLIDEKLQIQEARRLEIGVEPAQIEGYLGRMAGQNNLSLEQFLEGLGQIGVDPETLIGQVEAEIAWLRLVSGIFQDRAKVTDEEVAAELERRKAAMSETQYLLSEIYLDIPNAAERRGVARSAESLYRQIGQGASFPALARQFSALPSAARGGDIGWTTLDTLPEEVAEAVSESPAGSVLAPIPTASGYYIVAVRDVQQSMDVANTDAIMSAVQLVMTLPQAIAMEDVSEKRHAFEAMTAKIGSCAQAQALSESHDDIFDVKLDDIRLSEMRPVFRTALTPLRAGEISPAMRAGSGLHTLIVCEREDLEMDIVKMVPPAPEEVELEMEDARLSLLAQRYLRDLRRDANIEVRL